MSITVDIDAEFSAWFDEVLPRVLRLTRRTASSASEAEDIASEALARAYAGWPKIRSLPYRDGWVLRTAANLSIDIARRRSRFPWRKLQFAEERASAASRSIEDTVADRRSLSVALAKLPTRQREAVSLRYLSGLSLEETAAVMGLGTETVRTHVSRGLAALRGTLGPTVEPGASAGAGTSTGASTTASKDDKEVGASGKDAVPVATKEPDRAENDVVIDVEKAATGEMTDVG